MTEKLAYLRDVVAMACLVLAVVSFAQERDLIPWPPDPAPTPDPEPGPEPEPEPNPEPIDSPFPAEGFWLLVASQGDDIAKQITAAEDIRNAQGLEPRWHDYDQSGLEEPWQRALEWAEKRSGGEPYFVLRNGNRAAAGALSGDLAAMHAAVLEAVEKASE